MLMKSLEASDQGFGMEREREKEDEMPEHEGRKMEGRKIKDC